VTDILRRANRQNSASGHRGIAPAPSQRARAGLAIGAALLCGALTALTFHLIPDRSNDIEILWRASADLRRGLDPYPLARTHSIWPLYYPLPAVLLAFPFSWFSFPVASTLWVGLIAGTFTYAMAGRGWWALLALGSGGVFHALGNGQLTPLLVAAALIPVLGGLLVVKPNSGLALFAMYPSRRAVVGAVAVLLASLALLPRWPLEWLQVIRDSPHIASPLARPYGWLLLLAALRWRDPRARLLLALALIPQNLLPHETVALALIPQDGRQMAIYAGGTWLAVFQVLAFPPLTRASDLVTTINATWPVMLLAVYLPMLWLVLRSQDVKRASRLSGPAEH
jgi:hypothetical protein